MNFTVTTIARSLAAHLAPVLPGMQMLEDPAQQGVEPPCMFLQQRYSNIKPHPGGRWLRTIGVDLTYLLDYNLPDLQQQYSSAAETLDLCMECFPIPMVQTPPCCGPMTARQTLIPTVCITNSSCVFLWKSPKML